MQKNYKGLIWTSHTIERMAKRGISQGDAWATWRRPDQSRKGRQKGTWIYYKVWGDQRIEVVAKKNEKGKWVILSVWSKPSSTRSRPVYAKKQRVEPLWKLIKKRVFKR